ncbi:hypothetical protein K7462_30205, partial [Pseudomonas fluorescens]|uniref:hypothetical protein n=1 Tax=Pseudomonas fluorescens TaxID=294 RepID=UPI001CA6FB8F
SRFRVRQRAAAIVHDGRQAAPRAFSVDAALDLEEHVNATYSLAGDRRLSLGLPSRQTSSGHGSSGLPQGFELASDEPCDGSGVSIGTLWIVAEKLDIFTRTMRVS